ncbi:fumarylacetoacetate hydrolase family protein [Aliiroseovarius sp. F20344]|uniref:fumarylacetoacetate hydrolase family protein n=1 Tax=Aliiroseovarius sp. F20344 TaxID=2926414 RepID=UPI001FF47FB5|nr:fumarylacetoacetate hydrolase family protein [Aliiroseovarius sp. F20344]MCK0141224.1 fumarylacetoacetate hydrolase family protein [Aliiroseovarius sp. F20344]
MTWAIPAPEQPFLPITNSDQKFPVRRIFCVGQNYAAHAREMGSNPERELPFFFTKPADALVPDGASIPFPPGTSNLHHEVELVVAIGKGGADIAVDEALDHVWGYAVGNDLTRRDVQADAKSAGRPWDMAKGFDRSAPCGALHPAQSVGHFAQGGISLAVNGELRQSSDISDLIWPVADVISYLSSLVELHAGDLIFTGTPEGVGPLKPGDTCVAQIDGLGSVINKVQQS